MNIRECLCFIFDHRWINLTPSFLADALKNNVFKSSDKYRYCYRCYLLSKKQNSLWMNVGKIKLSYLPFDSDNIFPFQHPILSFLISVKYFIFRCWEYPGDMCREIKYFVQRGRRGYSDRDVWYFYGYLSDVIHGGLKKLKKLKHGYPAHLKYDEKGKELCSDEEATKKFNDVFDTMIYTFNTIQKVEEDTVFFYTKKEQFKNFVKKNYSKSKILTKQEQERYEKGWKLFKEYFFALWD